MSSSRKTVSLKDPEVEALMSAIDVLDEAIALLERSSGPACDRAVAARELARTALGERLATLALDTTAAAAPAASSNGQQQLLETPDTEGATP